jgi:hypothetical protein
MRFLLGLGFLLALSANAQGATLSGWEGMRVINQEGLPQRMLAVDLFGEGRDQLVVVNTRLSRLDFYRWLPADQRAGAR